MPLNSFFFILSFFVVILSSCGDRGDRTATNEEDNSTTEEEHTNPDDCQSNLISNDQCFYPLPDIGNGESFKGIYKDTSEIDTRGVSVGHGVWECRNGRWFEIQAPVCLTCLPGRSLEYCQSQLDRLIRNRNN